MSSKLFILSILSLFFCSSVANSGEPICSKCDHQWAGPYAGLHFGYASLENAVGDPTGYSNPSGTVIEFGRGEEISGGGLLGYNWQCNQLVVGFEIDGIFGNFDSDVVADLDEIDEFSTTNVEWISTIRGRVGFAHKNSLFYLTGGLAIADIENTLTDFDAGMPDPDDSFIGNELYTGWIAGIGVETIVNDCWSFRVEGLIMDLEPEAFYTQGTNQRFVFDHDAVFIRAALVHHF